MSSFLPRPLASESLPSSIPLLVPQDCDYDPVSFTITKRPVDLLSDETQLAKHLCLVPKALELLSTIKKPVAVLSICGPYRSGKSYFLSRVLGVPNAFNISHTMKACTRGIWMATTALECDEFVIVFLDTEGTDDVAASESTTKCNFSLLVLTTLLSSCLIYNSMHVPRRSDLEAMSSFAQLSSSITTGGVVTEHDYHLIQQHFPKFVWLLRDVSLLPEDSDGEEIPITDFIKEHILVRSTQPIPSCSDHVVYAILNLFPSFECKMLPVPSAKRSVLKNITDSQSQLSTEFNEEVDKIKMELLGIVSPKAVFGCEASYLTGSTLAALAKTYVESLNTPDTVPDLLNSWELVVGHELNRLLEELVEQYTKEMETILEDKYPLEEKIELDDSSLMTELETGDSVVECTDVTEQPPTTLSQSVEEPEELVTTSSHGQSLMDIHQSILEEKMSRLESAVSQHAVFASNDVRSEMLEKLKKRIVQHTEETGESVVGGELFRFVQKNSAVSQKHCNQVFDNLSSPLKENLSKDLDTFEERYYSLAVGPAKKDVYSRRRPEFDLLSDYLAPGPPGNFRSVGRATDRVKIRWRKPTHHSRAVKEYEFQISRKHQWFTLAIVRRHSVVVCSLKPSTTYIFRVRANNTLQAGEWSEEIKVKTRMSTGERYGLATASFVGGTISAPFVMAHSMLSQGMEKTKECTSFKDKALTGAGVIAGGTLVPLVFACSGIYASETGASLAKSVYESTGTSSDDDLDESNAVCISGTVEADMTQSTVTVTEENNINSSTAVDRDSVTFVSLETSPNLDCTSSTTPSSLPLETTNDDSNGPSSHEEGPPSLPQTSRDLESVLLGIEDDSTSTGPESDFDTHFTMSHEELEPMPYAWSNDTPES